MRNDDLDLGSTDDIWPAAVPSGPEARAYGGPAHDYLGNYLYVPIAADAPTAADEMGRVLRFPSGGRNPA